jgi:hypothetical protein
MDKKLIEEVKKQCKEEKVELVCDVDLDNANWLRNLKNRKEEELKRRKI